MVKNHRKFKNANTFKSICGNNLKLTVEKNDSTISIRLLNQSKSVAYTKSIALLIVVIMNLFSLLFSVLNLKLITAIFFVTLLFLLQMLKTVKEEKLVILKGLGLHLTTKYTVGFKTKFIPQERVQTFFINEVIYRNKVVYVLTLFTKEPEHEPKLIPLFFDTMPRLPCLEVIYSSMKELDK